MNAAPADSEQGRTGRYAQIVRLSKKSEWQIDRDVLGNREFQGAVRNVLIFTVVAVPAELLIGLSLASTERAQRGKPAYDVDEVRRQKRKCLPAFLRSAFGRTARVPGRLPRPARCAGPMA